MTDWNVELQELRREYRRVAPERLDRLVAQIDGLRQNPGDSTALSELRRAFHTFAGSGTTFGFPDVSRLSALAEAECAAMIERRTPSASDLERWKDLVEALREQLAVADTDSPA